jgi:hypothetical protein
MEEKIMVMIRSGLGSGGCPQRERGKRKTKKIPNTHFFIKPSSKKGF